MVTPPVANGVTTMPLIETLLFTVTVLAFWPLPPLPPTASATDPAVSGSLEPSARVSANALPPLPPLPPMDWATIPEPRSLLFVLEPTRIWLDWVTVTVPAVPPVAPLPPREPPTVIELLGWIALVAPG